MKAFHFTLATAVSALIIGTSAAQAQTVLRYTEGGPNRGARADALKSFADRVEELSEGDLKIDIIWGGALLKFSAAAEGIKNGVADMGTVLAAYAPNQMKALSIGDLPIEESNDPWVGMRAMYDLFATNAAEQESLAKQNTVYVYSAHSTALQISCKGDVEIRSIEDLKGLKMRASGLYAKVFADLGANMVNLTFDEIYPAYDSGLIDCDAGYFYTIKAYKLDEVIDRVYRIDFGQIGGIGIVANKDRWDSLTDRQREILRQAGSETIDYFARLQITEMDDIVTSLKDGGRVEVLEAPEGFRAALSAAAEPYVQTWKEEFAAAGIDPEAVLADYNGLLGKYAAERDAQGYPWDR